MKKKIYAYIHTYINKYRCSEAKAKIILTMHVFFSPLGKLKAALVNSFCVANLRIKMDYKVLSVWSPFGGLSCNCN